MVRGKFTAATTYPALAQVSKRDEYGPLHSMNPGANMISGSGPAASRDPVSGYQTVVASVRWPSCWLDGPVCSGSRKVR